MTYQTGINLALLVGSLIVLRRATKTLNRLNTKIANIEAAEQRIDERNMEVELYNERQRQYRQHEHNHRLLKQTGCAWCQGLAQ